MLEAREIHLVFDAPPGRNMPTLVEVEHANGRGIEVGEWHQRPDGYWEIVFRAVPD